MNDHDRERAIAFGILIYIVLTLAFAFSIFKTILDDSYPTSLVNKLNKIEKLIKEEGDL